MDVKFHTTGFNELKEAFKMMPEQYQTQVLASGVLAGAKVIQKAAVAAAPRGGVKGRSNNSFLYGRLFTNLKARMLRKRQGPTRAAVVTRSKAFWGDFLNRGTRYIPATHWYDNVISAKSNEALQAMKQQMVKKMKSVSDAAIRKAGASKR